MREFSVILRGDRRAALYSRTTCCIVAKGSRKHIEALARELNAREPMPESLSNRDMIEA